MNILSTARLTLRELTVGDAADLYRIHREEGVWKYFLGSPPASVAEERAFIERHLRNYQQHGFGFWATVLRETGELVGRCGLLAQEVDGRKETEIAYLLSPRFWGRGLASGAARGLRDYGFQTLGCPRLVSLILPENAASKRVAIAAGLRLEKNTAFAGREVEVYSVTRPPR